MPESPLTSTVEVVYRTDVGTLTDNGPNHGLRFISALRNFSASIATRFRYALSPDLMANNSAFYKAQCGNYDAVKKPNGFIRGSVLRSNVQAHEYGTVLGHYQQYGMALQNPADNLGQIAEARVRDTTVTVDEVVERLVTDLTTAATNIQAATSFEACNSFVERDQTCTFRGYINFFPDAACR